MIVVLQCCQGCCMFAWNGVIAVPCALHHGFALVSTAML